MSRQVEAAVMLAWCWYCVYITFVFLFWPSSFDLQMLRPNFRSSFWGSSLCAQVLNLKFWLNFFLHASFESKFWLKFMRSSFELKFLCSSFEPQVLAQFFALNFWVQVLAHKFWLTSWAERGGVVIEDQCAERSEAEWRRAHWLPRITTWVLLYILTNSFCSTEFLCIKVLKDLVL